MDIIKHLLIILLYFWVLTASSQTFTPKQQQQLDNFNSIINNSQSHDTSLAKAYVELSTILAVSNLDTIIPLSEKSISIVLKADFKQLPSSVKKRLLQSQAEALINIGYVHLMKGDNSLAINYYDQSKVISEAIDDKKSLGGYYISVGYIYNTQGDIFKALEYYNKSLKIREELNDKVGVANVLSNIGNIYLEQGDLSKALEYFYNSLKIDEGLDNKVGVAYSLTNLGKIYSMQDSIQKALEFYYKALNIRKEIDDKRGMGESYNLIGYIHDNQGDLSLAMGFFYKSLIIRETIGDKKGISNSYNSIGSIYLEQGRLANAQKNGLKSLIMAQEIGYPVEIRAAAQLLKNIYEKQNKGMKALEMHELYIMMRDSLQNEEKEKEVYKQQLKYEFESKEESIRLEQEKQQAIAKIKERQKSIVLIAVSVGMLLTLLFLAYLYNRFRIIRGQKVLIESQSGKIKDSITYAQRIQNAILPSDSDFKNNFKDSFIYFKPKDVVSGDFYWFYKVENKVFFSVIDCTGHGVPGAFMSLICNNLLDKVVAEKKIFSPEKILNQLSIELISRLSKGGSDDVDDGMDLMLCCIDTEKNILEFSGARNSLFLLRDNEIQEYIGDMIDMGSLGIKKLDKKTDFTLQTIQLKENDSIYLFSDGFVDQFGGPKSTKFYVAPFVELLKEIGDKPMIEQKELINQKLTSWISQGEYDQIDDVCVLGVRV